MTLPLPTALGWKFLAFWLALVVAFFGAAYSNLFFLLLVFLTLLGLLSLFWSARNGAGVTGSLSALEPIAAGTGAALVAELDGCMRDGVAEIDLMGSGVLRGLIPALPRGIYRVRGARVTSAWPTGLFRARVALKAPEEIVVFPAPAEIAEEGGAAGLLAEIAGSGAGGLQPSGLREFRSGDEPRRIHWKASARRGAFVVKEWDGAVIGGCEIALDRRAKRDVLEEALSLLAALALEAKESKETLALHTQGLSATFGTAEHPYRELLRFLAGAQPLSPDAPGPPPTSPGTPRLPR